MEIAPRYASTRAFFEDGADFPEPSEVAAVLCRVYDKPQAAAAVRRILRRPHSGAAGLLAIILRIPFAYLFEISRHQDLQKALDLPTGSVGGGYKYVDRGETPEGITHEMIRKTLGGSGN
jgi:hypothetical protein